MKSNSIFERRYQRFAWAVLAANVLVILWGAFVRATGSGAGCGGNWPLCHGNVVPFSPTVETLIEYTHRLTSGLALLLTLAMTLLSRKFAHGRRVRKAAFAAGVFILLEALIGAGLVLFDLVGGNTSVVRAFASAVHLSNTYLLLGSITLTAVWAHSDREPFRSPGGQKWLLISIALVGMIVVGAMGSITALGDTIFPSGSVSSGFLEEMDPASHFLVRLRVIHPIVALVIGAFILIAVRAGWFAFEHGQESSYAGILTSLIILQWIAGAVNVLLLAPIWMQIIHLFVADVIWIVFILYLEKRLYPSSAPKDFA
jgi:heme A synthase